jgi:hypothetical protein
MEEELGNKMAVGGGEAHLARTRWYASSHLWMFSSSSTSRSSFLEGRTDLLKALLRKNTCIEPGEVASVDDQIGDNPIVAEESPR